MSFEITNDRHSERFRDLVARVFIETLGSRLQYGPWSVSLRSRRALLSVVMTGPDEAREEWLFGLASGSLDPATMDEELRRRLTGVCARHPGTAEAGVAPPSARRLAIR